MLGDVSATRPGSDAGRKNHLGNAESSELHIGLTASSEPAEPQRDLRDMSPEPELADTTSSLTNAGQSAYLTCVIEGKSYVSMQWIATDAIKPNARNARTHAKKQIRQIADSITAFGSPWQNGYAERLIGSIRRECLGPAPEAECTPRRPNERSLETSLRDQSGTSSTEKFFMSLGSAT
jgi:transposase InsO family protein